MRHTCRHRHTYSCKHESPQNHKTRSHNTYANCKALSKPYETKFLQRCHLLLGLDLGLRVVCIPNETPLERTECSFSSGYQLDLVGQIWGLLSICSLNTGTLYMSFDCCQVSVSSYVCWSCCVQRALIPQCPPFPLAIKNFPLLLLQASLSPEGRHLMGTSLLGLGDPRSLSLPLTLIKNNKDYYLSIPNTFSNSFLLKLKLNSFKRGPS